MCGRRACEIVVPRETSEALTLLSAFVTLFSGSSWVELNGQNGKRSLCSGLRCDGSSARPSNIAGDGSARASFILLSVEPLSATRATRLCTHW